MTSKRKTKRAKTRVVQPTPLPQPKKTVGWEWKHPRGHLGILAIDSGDGQGPIHYLVRRVDVDYIAFNLMNLNKTGSAIYSVVVNRVLQEGYCTCPGFKAYGKCRHFGALSSKVERDDALNR